MRFENFPTDWTKLHVFSVNFRLEWTSKLPVAFKELEDFLKHALQTALEFPLPTCSLELSAVSCAMPGIFLAIEKLHLCDTNLTDQGIISLTLNCVTICIFVALPQKILSSSDLTGFFTIQLR